MTSLFAKTARNSALVALANFCTVFLAALASIFAARVLSQDDFGLIAASSAVAGFLAILFDFGLGVAVLSRPENKEPLILTAGSLRLVIAGLLTVAGVLLAPNLAEVIGDPRIAVVFRVQLTTIFVGTLGWSQILRFSIRLDYGPASIARIVGGVAGALTIVGAVSFGLGYVSLVLGPLVAAVLSIATLYRLAPWKFDFSYDPKTGRDLLGFGAKVMLALGCGFLITYMDRLFLTAAVGLTLLGSYQLGYAWGFNLSQNIGGVTTALSSPTFASIRDDRERSKRGFLQASRWIGTVSIPAGIGLALVAPAFVRAVLAGGSPKWDLAIGPLAVFSLVGILKTLADPTAGVLMPYGKSGRVTLAHLVGASVIGVGFLVLSYTTHLDILSASVAVGIGLACDSFLLLFYCLKELGVHSREYLSQFRGSMAASVVMTLALLPLVTLTGAGLLTVLVAVPVGLCVYVGSAWIISKETFRPDARRAYCLVRGALAGLNSPPRGS